MTNDGSVPRSSVDSWQAGQVYALAAICLIVGLALGYFFRGSQSPAKASQASATVQPLPASGPVRQMPTLDQMKHMADKKAEPLLGKLQADPKNATLLAQVGDVYRQTHQFSEAADYYRRALDNDPKNAGIRSDLASSLYYGGDVEGALAALRQALQDDPNNGAALFNLGMIKYQAGNDRVGAIAAWKKLLQANPKLPPERKAAVEKMIQEASR